MQFGIIRVRRFQGILGTRELWNMEYHEIMKLVNLGVDLDAQGRKLTLRLGPVTIKEISLRAATGLSKNPRAIAKILSGHFINRQVMWQDFRRETVEQCVGSLEDLKNKNEEQADAFSASGEEGDRLIADLLQAWANECDAAIKEFRAAAQTERDSRAIEFDSEFVLRATDEISRILGEFRTRTYPIVDAFIESVAAPVAAGQVGQQALDRLEAGKNLLIQYYGVSSSRIARPSWEV